MPFLLAPLLGQVVTLGVSDRTEARAVFESGNTTTEGSTSPAVGLGVSGRNATFAVGYNPTFTLRPLEEEPREVLVSHLASAGVAYTHRMRRMQLTLRESATYTQSNPRDDILLAASGISDAPVPGAEPDAGSPDPDFPDSTGSTPERAPDQVVRVGSLTTTLEWSYTSSARSTWSASASHNLSSGVDRESRREYPLTFSEQVGAGLNHRLTRRDNLSLTASVTHSAGRRDSFVWLLDTSAAWTHMISRRTVTNVGAGAATSYERTAAGEEIITIYPTGVAGLRYSTLFARGRLGLGASVSIAPIVDQARATVDPRLGAAADASWSRDRTTVSATVGSAISVASDEDAFNSIGASASVTYDLGAGFSADAGVRTAWQTLGGDTLIPPVWGLFIGVSWQGGLPLYGGR
jgi:hypothetical protein